VIDERALTADLARIGLGDRLPDLLPAIRHRLSPQGHGDFSRWQRVVEQLPHCEDREEREALLLALSPWRKGPFDIDDIRIDAEWRSDLKWQRVAGHLSPLTGRAVLDVGCGNGWYAFRMLDAGASLVIGIDPTILFVMQFIAVQTLTGRQGAHVLPLRLEELPPKTRVFDTAFSMGVLYHRRDPGAHLAELRQTLRPGGELVLETLVLPGDQSEVRVPEGRYARMRNVHHLPTTATLLEWLEDAGFRDARLVDQTRTTTEEQRPTRWMTFESLAHALDPDDPSMTVEGLPAPTRAVVIADAP
jgi:tRNA (mo5U34)-methyltransferase